MLRQEFAYRTPRNAADAVRLRRADAGAAYLAGGTDVVPLMQYGVLNPTALVALSGLPELGRVALEADRLVIGGGVTLHALERFARERLPLQGLAQAARAVASPQIRRVGTVAGNLLQQTRCRYYNQTPEWRQGIDPCYKTGGAVCHQAPASPDCRALYYSDLAPMLLAMGGALHTTGGNLPLYAACGDAQALGADLLEAVVVPEVSALRFTAFRKVAVRGGIDFALANAALAVRAGNRAQLVMGAMNPRPVFLPETAVRLERCLRESEAPTADIYTRAEEEARSLARPIREAGVSGAVKMDAVRAVLQVIRDLEFFLRAPDNRDS